MSAAPKGEPPVERRPGRQGEVRRGATILLGIGLGTLGVSNLSVDGAAAPPGGLTVTRRYDPAAAVTVFTVDIGEGSDSSLFLPACPRAQVLGVDGAGGAAVLEIPSGTTVRFPAEATGTYRVSVAGDMSDRGPGTSARGCADYAGIIEPAVVTRGGAELGPSTRITKLP